MDCSELIYDWNNIPGPHFELRGPILVIDESLRDGLQSPSVRDPSIEEKIEILHLMEEIGIQMADIGLPGAGARAVQHAEALAREIGSARMKLRPNCAARTLQQDIRPIAEISERTGVPITAAMFIGSSPIRRYTEGWTPEFLVRTTEQAVRFAVGLGLEVMYVTEDTTRCDPETVKRLYTTALENGARAIVVCDTCGHATPMGALHLVRFIKEEVVKPFGEEIRIDWHGHCDRGMGLANALAAIVAGAHCIHGCALGIGERVGNTQLDQVLVNLKLLGIEPWAERDLSKLKDYCHAVSQATGVPIPRNYPVVGEDAYRTGTGVHAAAVIKALKRNDIELADNVYSGVPAHLFGLEQVIEIGPMSGKSNVLYWLERHGIAAREEVVERIFARAKASDRVLSRQEILECCEHPTIPLVS